MVYARPPLHQTGDGVRLASPVAATLSRADNEESPPPAAADPLAGDAGGGNNIPPAFVFDNGSGIIKSGFGTDTRPAVFSAVVGTPKYIIRICDMKIYDILCAPFFYSRVCPSVLTKGLYRSCKKNDFKVTKLCSIHF